MKSESHTLAVERYETPSTAVALTVAEVIDTEPENLPPLYKTINTDALDSLFKPVDETSHEVHVVFRYEGHIVEVRSAEEMTVTVEPVE
ncbi:HalOD1 output domain-containing protein [Natrononativus amylolyticus]|uniref:HalOD1 output domain-containing protein n=1 Tax=Natrononativus amylolyticus TaxID=2963434 RepID=UPI0020CD52F2|nr:HalOD1 output domain-containing protein [Natrononativus amylolyticus]